ncbi:glycosyltransferase [Ornithobacterium rhinotracheale]|uniref:glycosyltransferase n=1 Tax=Ornithobacterium rhinotracheale TaxID=28251 RepID=UPI001FF1F1C6|nr:glycosyltransferase [Ornithobacterium rhinotracheale]MCK0202234.1 glycosyltransferase [Ornithobacterium rhinotracheale]
MHNKTICFIIPLKNSFDAFLKELAKYLVIHKWNVYVICNTPEHKDFLEENINFINCNIPRGANLITMLKASYHLKKILNRINPNIVHAHFQTAILCYQITGLVSKFKSFATIHGAIFNSIENKFNSFFFKKIEQFSFRKFQTIFVLNNKDFIDVKKINTKTTLYPCYGVGCNIELFDPLKFKNEDLSKLKQKYGIKNEDFVIIFVGRLVHFKGYQRVIKSFKVLNDKYSNLKLLVLGAPDPIHKSGLSEDDEIYIKKNPNIIHVGLTKDVAKHFAISNLTFFPSIKEGLPVNLMESIAMNIPIVTTKSRGCDDLVSGKNIGEVVDSLEIADYVKIISNLIDNSKILDSYKKNMLKIRNLVDRKNFILHEFNLYEKALKEKSFPNKTRPH